MKLRPIHSKMSIKGHPIHPALIHVPIGALVGVVATDLGFIFSGDLFWARAGLWLAGVGALMGFLAGIVGLVELLSVRSIRRLITGWCHGLMAVMLMSLASFNWMIRLEDPGAVIMPWGLYLSVLCGVLTAVTASLGGHLVYEHGVGMTEDVPK